jgi:hypothetical protein
MDLERILQFSSFSQNEINAWINGHNACLTEVLSVNISAISPVCSSNQLNIVGLPQNSSITSWSSSNNSGLTVSSSGAITRQNNFNGIVNVSVNGNFGNDGCTFSSTRPILVGNYHPTGSSSVNSNCSGSTFNILNTSLSGVCSANSSVFFTYNITDPNYSNFVFTPVSLPSGTSWSATGSNLTVTVIAPPSTGSRTATIVLSATGPCGPYSVNFNSTAVNIHSSGFSMAPNPSNDYVTIKADNKDMLLEDSSDKSQNLIYAIIITSTFGNQVKTFDYKDGIKSVNVSLNGFTSGLYFLSVFDGKAWSSKQLIVQK